MKKLILAAVAGLALTGMASAETATEFATRLQQHFGVVANDPRVVTVARYSSPSNVTLEFGLTAEGKARDAKIVHSIVSQDDQKLILDALNELPPFAIDGFAGYDATYRLPMRLDLQSAATN